MEVRGRPLSRPLGDLHFGVDDLSNGSVSALFEATVEATEEAIYNSLLKAETVTSNGRTVQALPIAETVEILRRYGAAR